MFKDGANRYILGQKRGEQSYRERLQQLNLMNLSNRRKYLSICFACSCINNCSTFNFSNWSINTRHTEDLLFNHHVTPKTDSFKHCISVNFPPMWSGLPKLIREYFILNTSNSFKKQLKKYFTQLSIEELDS